MDSSTVICWMLDEFICHFRGVGSILLLIFYFLWKILLADNVDIKWRLIWVCTVFYDPLTGVQVKWVKEVSLFGPIEVPLLDIFYSSVSVLLLSLFILVVFLVLYVC